MTPPRRRWRAVSLHQKAAEIGADLGSRGGATSTTANIAAKLGIEIEGPDVSGAVSKATEEVAEGVQSFFRTAADEDARRQKLIDGMYANSAAPIILDEYDGGPDGVGVEEIAVGEEVARDVLRPVDSAYLVGRDALVGEVDSSALLDRDEAAGLWPLGLDRSASAVQLPFVYEPDCIGCTWCASIARATFRMNGDDNKARCVQQGEDADAVEEAIEACPADCIHLVSRTQLAALEAQRLNGTTRAAAGVEGPDHGDEQEDGHHRLQRPDDPAPARGEPPRGGVVNARSCMQAYGTSHCTPAMASDHVLGAFVPRVLRTR